MKNTPATSDLERMTMTELRREIVVHRTEYAKMRMGIEVQTQKNHALFKSKRREIARMETALTAMESKETASQSEKKPVKVPRSK